MSVQRRLRLLRAIVVEISNRPDCVEITGYKKISLDIFLEALDKAIGRYEAEAKRVRKYYP